MGDITVVRRPVIVRVTNNAPIQWSPSFVPFSFVATEGQTIFTLDVTPGAVLALAIDGVMQNQDAGDFTVAGAVITLSSPVSVGTTVFGMYQE